VLEELRISGLGVIHDAVLALHPGLTVVTGETGAGKTMVVQGLGLVSGARADTGRVAEGGRAVIEARLRLPVEDPALARAQAAGAHLDDDGSLLAVRSVSAAGRSQAALGGAGVPAALLAEVVGSTVTVHGQSDQALLLRPAEQRDVLDRFAGPATATLLARYAQRWSQWREVVRVRDEAVRGERQRLQEVEALRAALDRIEALDPQPGEEERLAEEGTRLGAAEELRAGAGSAAAALLGGEDDAGSSADSPTAAGLLAAARAALQPLRELDPSLAALGARVDELTALTVDAGADLLAYTHALAADPLRLGMVQERRAALRALVRAYGPELGDVLEWAAAAALRLAELEAAEGRGEQLTAEADRLAAELAGDAGRLREGRQEAAARLQVAVAGELSALAMPHARVEALVGDRAAADGPTLLVDGALRPAGRLGVDRVELLLASHPGAPARSLARGASGGELSRVMLALEVVLAGATRGGTLVFDEVDAGVGGRAAGEVGARLARLAREHQVVCVTHLPQVAAYADRHVVVSRDDAGTVSRSGLVQLDDAGRVVELSRMLAGQEGSALARGHAEELLDAAAAVKAT